MKQINPSASRSKACCFLWRWNYSSRCYKGKTDIILISGHNGGTGAHHKQVLNMLEYPGRWGNRGKPSFNFKQFKTFSDFKFDGGIKTGRDVVIAAMMGAEEFGIATGTCCDGMYYG